VLARTKIPGFVANAEPGTYLAHQQILLVRLRKHRVASHFRYLVPGLVGIQIVRLIRIARPAVTGLFFVGFCWLVIASSCWGDQQSPADEPVTIDLKFESAEGYFFDARIVTPVESRRNGYGVLLLAGGMGNDLDWTVPGFMETESGRRRLTINGQSHADAPLIACGLARQGFVVMHYSTIRRGDPLADRWPSEATLYSMPQQVGHARAALAAFRAKKLVDANRVFLFGHSLGAVRAANLAATDIGIAGLVLTGAAQVTRTSADDRGRNMNAADAQAFLEAVDHDDSGSMEAVEFDEWRSGTATRRFAGLVEPSFQRLDFDKDGRCRLWEISAGLARHRRSAFDPATLSRVDASGLRWIEDLLAERPDLPVLLVYGSLDNAQAHHAPIVADLIDQHGWTHVEILMLPNLGHQLGPEKNGLIGPFDSSILSRFGESLKMMGQGNPD
jgi:pimeloyl-ACP methyl ester carboxylesterase